MISVSQFYGAIVALLVSLMAFTVVFVVLAGLFAIIVGKRYLAVILEKRDIGVETALPAIVSTPVSQTEVEPAPVAKTAEDIKKLIAAISAAINVSIGKSVKITSVMPVQRSDANIRWRTMGIAECMKSRLGSRSW